MALGAVLMRMFFPIAAAPSVRAREWGGGRQPTNGGGVR